MAKRNISLSASHVGIWWDNGTDIVALSHAPDESVTHIGDRIDSNLAHVDEWPNVAVKLGHKEVDEYFCVPRGRVLWDTRKRRGIILHGPATSHERLELIAQRFTLGEGWRAETDCHYYTDADADRLFDEE